jgi:hypothetical protein
MLLCTYDEREAGPIANGPVGWTRSQFLLANRIVGASVGTAPQKILVLCLLARFDMGELLDSLL